MGELFVVHKNRREARALIFTHQLGWEVRLLIGTQLEVVQTQVCRTHEEVVDSGERWKAAMIAKGWRNNDSQGHPDEKQPSPIERPVLEENPPLDDAPVPPLTEPEDTEGG